MNATLDSEGKFILEGEYPKLLLGDCLKLMKELPEKSVDCTITSVPFMDKDVPIDWYDWLKEFHFQRERITRDYSIEFHSSTKLKELMRRTDPFRWLVWYEKQVNTPYRWQPILVYRMDSARYNFNAYCWQDHMTFPLVPNRKKLHINQDPIGPYERCLHFVDRSKKCNLVIDPCLGSGTSGMAAKLRHMKFIGMEIEQDRMEIAKKRIAQEMVQLRLESYEEKLTDPDESTFDAFARLDSP